MGIVGRRREWWGIRLGGRDPYDDTPPPTRRLSCLKEGVQREEGMDVGAVKFRRKKSGNVLYLRVLLKISCCN